LRHLHLQHRRLKAFDLSGSTGTFSCPGKGFVETDYSFGGFEDQVWYGKAPKSGFGKSITNGYLYKWVLADGACAASAKAKKGSSQAQGK
jgi:hypothetical protein